MECSAVVFVDSKFNLFNFLKGLSYTSVIDAPDLVESYGLKDDGRLDIDFGNYFTVTAFDSRYQQIEIECDTEYDNYDTAVYEYLIKAFRRITKNPMIILPEGSLLFPFDLPENSYIKIPVKSGMILTGYAICSEFSAYLNS